MQLTLTAVQNTARTYAVHRVIQSWSEGNSSTSSGATWKNRTATQTWTTLGGDFAAAATATAPTGTKNGAKVQWDVTVDVAAFLAGTAPNYGWLVKDASEGSGREFRFASRENGVVSSRPQLVLTYGPCPPAPTAPTDTPSSTVP